MICPVCSENTEVRDTRHAEATVRSRRRCLSCEYDFTTYEMAADSIAGEVSVKISYRMKGGSLIAVTEKEVASA